MAEARKPISLDQSLMCQITVQGRLDQKWSTHFNGMTITTETVAGVPTVTILRGVVADQAALHGVLNKIRDLGLPLLSVKSLAHDEAARKDEDG